MQPICQIMNTKIQQAGENTKQAAYDILSNVHEWGISICSIVITAKLGVEWMQ